MDPNVIYVFDKGYNDYKIFYLFCKNNVGFVTRIRDNAVYSVIENLNIDKDTPSSVLEDTIIEVSFKDENKDRKSTRLNCSHVRISYAVFCLKKKKKKTRYNNINNKNPISSHIAPTNRAPYIKSSAQHCTHRCRHPIRQALRATPSAHCSCDS